MVKTIDKSIENIIKYYIEQLEEEGIHIQQAIVFGSYVDGKNNEWSDIDIAIVSENFDGNRFKDKNKIRKLTLKINSDISPIPFRPEDFNESNYFVKEIIETGKRIV